MSEKSSTFAPAFVRKGVKSPFGRRQIAEANYREQYVPLPAEAGFPD